MKYKKLTYGIVAILTILSFVSVSTFSTCARQIRDVTGEDLGGWHTYSGLTGGNAKLLTSPPAFYDTCTSDTAKQILFYTEKKDVTVSEFLLTVDSDDEIVVGFQPCTTSGENKIPKISLVSKNPFGYGFDYNSASYDSIPDRLTNYIERGYNSDAETYLDCHYSVINWIFRDYDTVSFATDNMKVFNSLTSACNYLNSGDTSGLIYDGANPPPQFDAELDFNKLDIIYHNSNDFDRCFIDFQYELSDDLKVRDDLYLDIFFDYQMGAMTLTNEKDTYNKASRQSIKLTDGASTQIYLKDIDVLKSYINDCGYLNDSGTRKRQILGVEVLKKPFNFGGTNTAIAEMWYKLNLSKLYLTADLVAGNVHGGRHNHSIDLINGSTDYHSSKPDTSGNYVSNNDYHKTEHFDVEVGEDAAGNSTYKYYKVDVSGNKVEISADDYKEFCLNPSFEFGGGGSGGSSAVVNGGNTTITNNPTFNNNVSVNVEGDSINNDVNNIVSGSEHTTESGNKGFIARFLAFFEILKDNTFMSIMGDMFGWLPSEVFLCLAYAIGLVGGVAVFRFFRK